MKSPTFKVGVPEYCGTPPNQRACDLQTGKAGLQACPMTNLVKTIVLFATVWASSAIGAAAATSEWAEGFNNRARLVAGRAHGGPYAGAGALYAGLEIVMSAGFKTYWRSPGEAGGIPPEFDFSGSQNLKSATVLFPAPHRSKDKAGETIGYHDSVLFPLRLVAEDPSKPVMLRVTAAYGVCKEICIAAEAALQIDVEPDPTASGEITAALARVPLPAPRSTAGHAPDGMTMARASIDPTLAGWRLETAQELKLVLTVEDPSAVDAPEDADAFLHSADGLYMPMTRKVSQSGGKIVYEADLTEGATAKELAGKSISVTLTGTRGQSETFIDLPNDLTSP